MPNYKLKFVVSEIASLLKVEKGLVKAWAFKFSDYLNPEANSEKGIQRLFSVDDICVLAYISHYWEDEPDIENIKYGLNRKDHLEPPFCDLITLATPLFTHLPEELKEEELNGIIYQGLSPYSDISILADAYKNAGDLLVECAVKNEEEFELLCPIIYNYRHATELYLKSAINNPKKNHDLQQLFTEFKIILKAEFNSIPPKWFEDIIVAFNDFDPVGTNFRYGSNKQLDEIVININHVKTLMGWLAESFQKIRRYRGLN